MPALSITKAETSVLCPLPSVRHPVIFSAVATLTCAMYVGHYIENIGNTTLHYLEIFNAGELVRSVTDWRLLLRRMI
jgi:hypothetical protein